MFAFADPNAVIGVYGLIIVGGYCFWRLIVWVRESPTRPDPWDAETERKLVDPDTPEICPHCSTPQPPDAWFCEYCGRAVGPYNNLMPFINCFSQGEVFRNGTSGRFRHRPLILTGFILISIFSYLIFSPLYLLLLIRNWRRQAVGETSSKGTKTS